MYVAYLLVVKKFHVFFVDYLATTKLFRQTITTTCSVLLYKYFKPVNYALENVPYYFRLIEVVLTTATA